ncbi:hypothetical protein [Parvicella tangerina]|uniref:Uncharacterized protein n=1 Tax=Parvicella tangerina TaxID=2829795 RepID=A0A916NT14_9FLAO|nr:hypothetical protein [Parvicella tangerina]CAG5085059.1 hypothetical protein CRYO30217_02637 [Parvicella tangerina]
MKTLIGLSIILFTQFSFAQSITIGDSTIEINRAKHAESMSVSTEGDTTLNTNFEESEYTFTLTDNSLYIVNHRLSRVVTSSDWTEGVAFDENTGLWKMIKIDEYSVEEIEVNPEEGWIKTTSNYNTWKKIDLYRFN